MTLTLCHIKHPGYVDESVDVYEDYDYHTFVDGTGLRYTSTGTVLISHNDSDVSTI